MARIMVGVDGSRESAQALAWAYEEAVLRGAELVVCHVYAPPEDASPYPLAYSTHVLGADRVAEAERDWLAQRSVEARDRAEEELDAFVRRVLPTAHRRVTPLVVGSDRPARALIRHAGGALLLVVGSRGRGGFAGLLLGSVSQQVAQHAPCPVAIVRPRDRDTRDM